MLKFYNFINVLSLNRNPAVRDLLDEIDVFEHTRVARHIPRSAEISLKYFETSGLSDEYFLDLDDVFLKNK